MSLLIAIIDFVLHIDKYLSIIIDQFGIYSYVILFLIIFIETGIVIAPFLPGDSLLFVAGTFAAQGSLNIVYLVIILSIAAILGDSLNYSIGKYLGKNLIEKRGLIKKEHLDKTKKFFDKHGNKTIIIARFVPIVRTFAPFVAGIGKMEYKKFLSYNVIGGLMWVFLFLIAGFLFGNISLIKDNLSVTIIIIIVLSLLPAVIEYLKSKKH